MRFWNFFWTNLSKEWNFSWQITSHRIKSLIFRVFLSLRDNLVATLNETGTATSIKYVDEPPIVMSSWFKEFENFWFHFSLFASEKQLKNLNFQRFFTSKRAFVGCFQWNACPYFQKICSWTIYSNFKLIINS